MLQKAIQRAFSSIKYTGLEKWGIRSKKIFYNLSTPEIYEQCFRNEFTADFDTPKTVLTNTGAMCAYSGTKYGRSPKEKRIVNDNITKDKIWWKDNNAISDNQKITPEVNKVCKDLAIKYLNTKPYLYVVDGYLGWDPEFRIPVRNVVTRAYHALFMKNMLIRPTQEELKRDFSNDSKIGFHIFNAGELSCPLPLPGLSKTVGTTVQCNFSDKTYTIIGSQYAGEMKKGLFTVMHFYAPLRKALSLHCSATEGTKGDVSLFFGLSGTGKTTLSADPKRRMLGDDEHVWTDNGVSNIEGGCYAKCINLSQEQEPDIYNAIKFGAIMENVLFKEPTAERMVDYANIKITENTRCSYPLDHISNAKFPSMAGHATNIVFLTCDAFGVMPPISRLTPEQAMYHFITGYTAKVAGTEIGIKEPVATFSSCFGAAFLAHDPTVYSELLAEKLRKHNSRAWLVNTGWTGGKYGVGKRMKLKLTRKIIDAINEDKLNDCEWEELPYFGLQIPKSVPDVPSEILNPKNTWANKEEYDSTLLKLAQSFAKNFKQYEGKASEGMKSANPKFD